MPENRVTSRGARLIWLRRQQNMTLRCAAKQAEIDPGLYSHLENDRKASGPALAKLARMFGVPEAYLAGSFEQYLSLWAATDPAARAAGSAAGRLHALLQEATRLYGHTDALAELARRLGIAPADLEDYLAGAVARVPGRLAQHLERSLGLPQGWVLFGHHPEAMDEWLNLVADLAAAGLDPAHVEEAVAAYLRAGQ